MRVHQPATQLVGLQAVGASSFAADPDAGKKFADSMWLRLIPAMIEAGLPIERAMFGVSWPADDLTPPQEVHYFVGYAKTAEPVPGEFVELALEGGSYFEYVYMGAPSAIDTGFTDAYMSAMPASGFQGREGQHLELYPDDYNPQAETITFKILIPIAD